MILIVFSIKQINRQVVIKTSIGKYQFYTCEEMENESLIDLGSKKMFSY